tara:strand:- start:1124 stop:1408 length:285 start_codon:yes stop_codon:yes gene_type:complete
MSENEIIKGIKNLDESKKKALGQKVVKELYLDDKEKGVLDAVQEKMVSRKLLVFIVSTALLAFSTLDPETWGMIALIYIGGQSAVDIAKIWKGI